MVVLVTRPVENAMATIARLEALGFEVLHDPLLQVEPLDTPMPSGDFSGVLITSTNAATVLNEKWKHGRRSVPVFTTGTATANAMLRFGFDLAMAIEGSALELVRVLPGLLDAGNKPERFLYPCAESTAHDLPEALAKLGLSCQAWPCYRTIEATAFSDATNIQLKCNEIEFVLLYSARTARCFARHVQDGSFDTPPIFCLSEDICRVLPVDMQAKCRFPNVPSEDALEKILPNAPLQS